MTEPRAPSSRSKRQTVRLACPCGRNLADLRLTGNAPRGLVHEGPMLWPERVWPFPRPGVRQVEHSHGKGQYTYRWDCRCGRTWEARRDRIDAIWREHAEIGRVIRLTFGLDVM